MSYSRGGTVGAATTLDGAGRFHAAASQQPQFHHQYNASTGLYDAHGVLLRRAATNSALGSSDLSITTYWVNDSSRFTLASAGASVIHGQVATRHTNTAAGASASRYQTVGSFVNGQTDCFWVIQENVDSLVPEIGIWDDTAGAWVHRASFTWATKATATVTGSGTSGAINLGSGRYLFYVTATGAAAGTGGAGNTRRAFWYGSGTASNSLASILHHTQFEANAAFPSFPIVTVAAAATRAADAASFAFNATSQQLSATGITIYDKIVVLRPGQINAGTIIGNTSVGGANCLGLHLTAAGVKAFFTDATTQKSSEAAVTLAVGDVVERLGTVTAAGSVRCQVSVNGGTIVDSGSAIAQAWPTAFNAARVYLSDEATAARMGDMVRSRVRIIPSVMSMAEMRAG